MTLPALKGGLFYFIEDKSADWSACFTELLRRVTVLAVAAVVRCGVLTGAGNILHASSQAPTIN